MPSFMDDATTIKYLEVFESSRLIAVDTETTGFKVKDGRDYLTGISIACKVDDLGIVSAYFPFRHHEDNCEPWVLERIKILLTSKASVYHNLKFDLHSLKTIGIEPQKMLYDTLMLAHMINEEWPSKKLDWLSKTFLNDQKDTKWIDVWSKALSWAEIPSAMMNPYAKKDAELTYRLFEFFWPKFIEQDLKELWPTEHSYTKLLTKIERAGVLVDEEFCKAKIAVGLEVMNSCRVELGFNPGSSIDLNKFLIEDLKLPVVKLTPGGKPSFDKYAMQEYDELLSYDSRHEARLVLTYRGWQKSVSSLYESMLKLKSPDGRVRPNFKQHGTKTGRLSCEEPNLQQIPRESVNVWNGDAKKAFIAPKGYRLIEFDYSQLEFRLATAYGQDRELLEAFEQGTDVFLPIAKRVFGTEDRRQDAKTLVYSTLYGAGIPRLMNTLGLDVDGAKRVWGNFRESYPGIYSKSQLAARNVERFGYVKYWTGRKRHLRKDASHKAFNAAVQGGAAEIVKRSMLRVNEQICTDDIRIVLTVHDSIVLEVKEDYVEVVTQNTIKLMTDWNFGVKFAVDAHIWGEK